MASKTLKSKPVMETRISSFDSSRRSPSWTIVSRFDGSRSHSWTLVENEYATLLLGEEGKIIGGYFLDDIHPCFFHVGGSGGLSYGPIDFLAMIGGKTSRTAEDSLDLECDYNLFGWSGLDDDQDNDDDDRDDFVGLEGLEDGVDFLGFNNILGLNRTTSGYNFVLISGEDYISGFAQFMGKYRPTTKFLKALEMFFTEVLLGPPKVKPTVRPPKVKPIKLKVPGLSRKSGPVSIRTKIRLKASSVPRRLVSVEEVIRIPVLLSYSENDGDLELYVPIFDARFARPPLAVNFSEYVMVSHNYRDCEFLLLNDCRREIIVYRLLDNTVVNLPYIQHYRQDCFVISGRFRKVDLGGGQSDYRVFVIAFHEIHHPVGTRLRLYYRQPLQQVWNHTNYLATDFIQEPLAFLVIGEFFAWVDIVSGNLCTIRNWDIDPAEGVPVLGPTIVVPLAFAGALSVFSVEDEERPCVVVHHHHMISVYQISIFNVQLPGLGNQLGYELVTRVNLSNRNFYCSVSSIGFSAPPLHLGAGPINAIFTGGYMGDCSRLNNYAEIVAQQNAGLHAVVVDFECLRHCHDPSDAALPLLCLCQSAFLLLPLHLLSYDP